MTDTKTVPCEPTEAMNVRLARSRLQGWLDRNPNGGNEAIHPDDIRALLAAAPAHQPDRQGAVRSEVLTADEGGCVTKRFVIFTAPGRSPEKKGGWLKGEHLIDFLRDVVLHDGWKPGFRATVLELTWNNDLWASNAVGYLSDHDNAIGPRRARKAWIAAREKYERIYGHAPKAKLGNEIDVFIAAVRPEAAAPPRPADTAMRELKPDFVRSLPSGFDDSTYEKIEDALDRLDAPMCDADGKWLTLAERVATLSRRDAAEGRPTADDDEDTDRCIACAEPFLADDQVFNDVSGGTIHARCCGPERESYVGEDGEPLKVGEPLPTPWRYGDIIPTEARS